MLAREICILSFLLALTGFYSLTSYAALMLKYQINGLKGPLLTNVQAHLEQTLDEKQLKTEAQIKAWYQQSQPVIEQALAPFAYFRPSIKSQLMRRNKDWLAYYQVNPGPLLRITQLELNITGEGADDPKLKPLLAEFSLRPGQVMSTLSYEQAKQQLYQAALAQGYLDAYWRQHRIVIDLKHYTAVITLEFETGPVYHFGLINLQQNRLEEAFLRRYIPFQAGDQYSADQLLHLQERWNKSGYFQQVQINERPSQASHQVDLTAVLHPYLPYQYGFSVGYGTDVGPRISLDWQARYLTTTGHRVSLHSQFSKHQDILQTTYSIPGSQPDRMQYNLSLIRVRNELTPIKTITQLLGLSAIYQSDDWKRTVFLNYQIDYSDDPKKHRSPLKSHLLTPGISWCLAPTNSSPYANNGYRLDIRLQGAAPNVLSSTGFLQTELEGKYIKSFSDNNYFVLRGNLGYTRIQHPDRFPPSLLFSAGGSQSVRGYNYQALGPGAYLLVASVEYQQRLTGDFYLATFFDAGNAEDHWPLTLKKGVGVGLVWASPVGPMELTLAKALDKTSALVGRPWRLQFGIGTSLL